MLYSNTISFFVGIIFEKFFSFGYPFAIFIFIISLSVFLLLIKEKKYHRFLFCFIFLAIGIFRMSFSVSMPDRELLKFLDQKISFKATVTEEPDKRDSTTNYIVSIDEKNISSYILLVAERFPEFNYGDKISVSGKIELPKNFISDSGEEFDYISYLKKDKIHFIVKRPVIEKIGEDEKDFLSNLYKFKKSFIEKIKEVVPEPNSSLIAGMIFGTKQSLGENILNDFKKVGLIHIVVLSGYNLTIIATSILYVSSYFGKRKFGLISGIMTIIIFGAMVGFTATVLRATIMTLIALLARHLGRESDALRALFVSGFFILLYNPLLISDPSFKLSFMATLGLILWSDPIKIWISKFRFQNFITTKFGIREIVSSTLAVQLFILPFLIQISGSFSFVSIFANLLVSPVVALLMLLGFLTGALGFITPVGDLLSWTVAIPAYTLSQFIIKVTEFGSKISFLNLNLGSISNTTLLIWYFVYALIYLKIKTRLESPPND